MALKSLTHDQNKVNQQTSGEVIWKVLLVDSNGDPVTLGFTNLTEFVSQTAWRVFYSDSLGDVTELALGADGTFLKSNGASSAPTFATPAGSGDVTKVGTPVNNQIGVWTGDGTLEGDASFLWDGTGLKIGEVAAAAADTAAFGQIWIKNDVPNILMFTDDAGTDFTIAHNATTALSSLTSIGTIATGVWEATDVGVAHGGTG